MSFVLLPIFFSFRFYTGTDLFHILMLWFCFVAGTLAFHLLYLDHELRLFGLLSLTVCDCDHIICTSLE